MNYQEYRQSLNQKLAERVERELADFREDILSKSPQEIYDAAYQIIIKSDIAECFSDADYSPQAAKALMKSRIFCRIFMRNGLDGRIPTWMSCVRPSQILNPIWLRRKRFCLGKRGDCVWMRSNRPYVQIDPDVLEQARQIDLLSYLRAYEPSNLVKVKGTTNVYCTAEHDSLKISNGKWYWWSRGFGGYSALDYLMKVKEYGFVEAVEILTGQTMADWKPPPPAVKKDEPKVLLLPPKNKNCDRVTEYLFGRGIDYKLIQECISEGIIFESADYHNAVFIGKDESGTPKYAACRGTVSSFKRDASGSDKRYSFRLLAGEPCSSVHLFEAAIDLLSFATYLKCEGKDYKAENLLSLSGVYQPKKEIKDSKIPVALTTFLKANPQIKTIFLHLDKDKAGRLCTAALKELLQKDYRIVDEPPPVGKDFNDFLMSYLGIARQKQSRERGDAR